MWEMGSMKRRYAVPTSILSEPSARSRTVEDLHAWSIYRQNLNSDFTDSALGTSEKSQPPFGNFHLQESTVQKILRHPKYGRPEQQSDLGGTAFSYLRFGLPRVFPPSRVHYNGSSGYDSSDDGSPLTESRRARTNMEFRNQVTKQSDHMAETSFARPDQHPRASSEADLLSHEIYNHKDYRSSKQRAQHASRNGYQRDPMPGVIGRQESRKPAESKAESNLTFNSSESKGHRDVQKGTPVGKNNNVPFTHPHLQVREMVYEIDKTSLFQSLCGSAKTKLKLLDGLSFEVHGGEILAIMSTTELEGTTILDILADRYDKWRSCLLGEIIVNGLHMTPAKLKSCVAYVEQNSDFSPDLSVQQTLLFASFLKKPSDPNRNRDPKGRINALLEDLGLGEVKHTRVRDITKSEKCRLNVACQLLLNTDIVLLDQPLKDMDIFDTFFLVEYLRQWAASGRIVVITLHPPTYEIFSMISRTALISMGKMLYFGKRKDMLPYFAYINFPCPAYKNPSDYY
ncbi:ATP-binding cassette sub-family G member 8-like, partial [Limulus polyphemus]|uniref:ATP-binding cassette sub-family G member 8-like n=1 Tax=Limulus polyphemus TaxID=6850 RepID=A0ABM1BXP3_LIMPO